MRFSRLLVVLALTISFATFASEPGQPLDCSDWVFHLPSLSCAIEMGQEVDDENGGDNWKRIDGSRPTDNERNVYRVRVVPVQTVQCGGGGNAFVLRRFEIWRLVLGVEQLVASIQERCAVGHCADVMDVRMSDGFPALGFYPLDGALRISFEHRSRNTMTNGTDCGDVMYDFQRLYGIRGFTTLFDVFHSYSPSAASLTFRVPVMPEGMAGTDRFDTYWGHLSTVGDWSQAHGLQCNYSAAPPTAGDYLEVADTLPAPTPGRGYYYVTSATYQGQTRYGRRTQSGQLSGRDPAVLPACTTE